MVSKLVHTCIVDQPCLLSSDVWSQKSEGVTVIRMFLPKGGQHTISRGWLTEQAEVHLQLYSNALTLWNQQEQMARSCGLHVACTAMNTQVVVKPMQPVLRKSCCCCCFRISLAHMPCDCFIMLWQELSV